VIDTRPNVVTKLYKLILTHTTDKLRHRFCLYDVYLLAFDTIIIFGSIADVTVNRSKPAG